MMWMILFLVLPLAGLAYVGWHVYTLLPLPAVWRWVIVALGVASFLLIFMNFARTTDRLPLWLARCVYNVGNSSIFVLLYLFMLFIVLDVLRLVRIVPSAWLHNNWWTAAGVLVLIGGIFVYGNLHYMHKVRQPLTLHTDKPLTKPVKLVMASDLHLGYHNPRHELARWVDLMNEEHADAILIAGDIIDGSIRPLTEEQMAQEFRRLNAPVYACLGNHEYYSGEPEAQRFYQEAGIHLLQDAATAVGDLCVIGRDDRTNRHRKALGKIMAETSDSLKQKYMILLDHQPYHLEQAERQGIDFQFSGHTHHGQVWPISWITDMVYECAFGAHQRGRTHYYVSSGLGIWGGKYRIGTRSEYIVATVE